MVPRPKYAYYRLSNGFVDCVYRKPGGLFIPMVDDNCEYMHYLAWVAEGNTAINITTPDDATDPIPDAPPIS